MGISGVPAVEVSEGIYAYVQPDGSWWINNAGFLVGRRGVISVDTCATESRTRDYQATIAKITEQPVRTIVNTHHHGDHTWGNALFTGATVVGHEHLRGQMEAFGPPAQLPPLWTPVDWGNLELQLPTLTFADRVTVWNDDLACEVRYVGQPAHTTNDSIVWIPERKVLFTGDLLFNGGTPFVLMGSVAGSIDVLENVLKPLNAETIIPGHGEVSGPQLIDDVLGYLRFIQQTAQAAKAAGLTPLEAARNTDLGQYADLLDPERLVGNLHRAYAELDDSTLDLIGAFTDMVTYNGGPLTSHA
ncbi:MBL fold metallo-hydrolase [Kribbella sp. NBC_00382]|uniref:MBL fold metallo-hydrolase n=1 Tax=Kribbella sp. NBC_00382 TaxID=2975967 RepID=UPI002E1FAF3E